jgi:hypothetical protein
MERRMSTKEAQRFGVMQQIDKKVLTLREASYELGLSLSQMKRVRKRYRLEGPEGLISKHLGKVSPNRTDPKIKSEIMDILRYEDYEGFGPTFARDKIEERHGHCLSSETIRKWMLKDGLWIPKKKKKSKVYQRRQRRGRFGDLIQGDGSRHAWFEKRGPECTMVIYVDDATSKITAARFVPAETTESYQQILEDLMNKYGRPRALYVDKHAIFLTSRNGELLQKTHFARVLKDLDIELIFAHSPQAKGRVERVHGTLQDRLIKEMRLRNICSIEEANAFLPTFIEEYNAKYGVKPRESGDSHRSLDPQVNLEKIFARRSTRKVLKDLSFTYEGVVYQIDIDAPNRFNKAHVTILDRPGKPILVEHNGKSYAYKKWSEGFSAKPKILDAKELEANWPMKPVRKPKRNHPWR